MSSVEPPLRLRLDYEPQELRFGTSGRRGEVVHLTHLEIYINVTAEIRFLQSLPHAQGGISSGDEFYVAYDLRPSSASICQAVIRAAADCGMRPVSLGAIPTPALAYFGFSRQRASIMVTGSHIPFDRNGYKLNTAQGELLKQHEGPIAGLVAQVRRSLYEQPFAESLFDERGMLKTDHCELPPECDDARAAYFGRYVDFFSGSSLGGKRIAVYQHSAVGRDLLVELLSTLGAEVIPIGRSETFVPIDTENIEASQLGAIQALADEAVRAHGPMWAVISADGDSDRPLVMGVESKGVVRFFGGDLVGMVVAEFLGADAVVVPISCNDGIDRGRLASVLEPKTKIGSPYVIEGLEAAREKGRRAICGWEANGGFLTGSDFTRNGHVLTSLPTRDAVLPILSVLFAAQEAGCSLPELFSRLPPRFSRAALLKNFPQSRSRRIIEHFTPSASRPIESIRSELQQFFTPESGFSEIAGLNYVDGVRIQFSSGDVAHIRPSGNADELRIYSVADSQERAESIVRLAIEEPAGILRSIERYVQRAT
jgi:phosphomannomutase